MPREKRSTEAERDALKGWDLLVELWRLQPSLLLVAEWTRLVGAFHSLGIAGPYGVAVGL